ncbi:MAG: type II toxin-antitoxin system VapC family toxin [Gaiellaceae bacterium]
MTVFVDTSALYALLDADDPRHVDVKKSFASLDGTRLLSHSYVVVESVALVERRLGRSATRDLLVELVTQIAVLYVDESIHNAATSAYFSSGPTGPSLVDFTSFEVMRLRGVRTALAVDRDFADAGFQVLPA